MNEFLGSYNFSRCHNNRIDCRLFLRRWTMTISLITNQDRPGLQYERFFWRIRGRVAIYVLSSAICSGSRFSLPDRYPVSCIGGPAGNWWSSERSGVPSRRETNALPRPGDGAFIKPHVVYWAAAPLTRRTDTGITKRAPTTLVIFKLVQLYICNVYRVRNVIYRTRCGPRSRTRRILSRGDLRAKSAMSPG